MFTMSYEKRKRATRTSWKSNDVLEGSQGPREPSRLDKEPGDVGDTGSTRTTRNS